MIEIKNITKTFPSTRALDDVSLTINQGEFFGLLGPNGAGKSTLMNLMVGYLNPDQGNIYIEGNKISREDVETRRKIGLCPQNIALYDDLSALENLEIFGSFYNLKGSQLRTIMSEQLNAVGLYERRKDKVKAYSGGMKRRLNMIASLLHNPSVLLFDEPTVGVDPQSRNAIFDFLTTLNKSGKTIVYTTHYMEEAERLCSRIAIIDIGKIIICGPLDTLLHKVKIEQTIILNKTPQVLSNLSSIKDFGKIIDEEDYFELTPEENFSFSSFFKHIEEKGITYQSIGIKKPSLEVLFLHLTGRRLRD